MRAVAVLESSVPHAAPIGGLVSVLGDPEPSERAEMYAALGVDITYQPDPRTAVPAVEPEALGQARVGGAIGSFTPLTRLRKAVLLAA